MPRILRIGKIGVEAKVLSLSIGANNQLRAPASIFDAGWYNGSALPGESGAVLIDGHVHGPTKPGVFVGLKKLKTGDAITLERGDGKVFTYRVAKMQSYAKDAVDMGAAFSSAEPGKPGLNIITCDGAYDDAGHYENRLVVFAVQQ
jgi:LPXTG-site transpeptidase (sortase) family protein